MVNKINVQIERNDDRGRYEFLFTCDEGEDCAAFAIEDSTLSNPTLLAKSLAAAIEGCVNSLLEEA